MSQKCEIPIKWTFNEERAFVENLLCKRFNFFLVVYGAIIGGVSTAVHYEETFSALLVVLLGTIITTMIAFAIIRCQAKLDILIWEIEEKNLEHPISQYDALYKKHYDGKWQNKITSSRGFIGYWIPIFCPISLALLFCCLLIAEYDFFPLFLIAILALITWYLLKRKFSSELHKKSPTKNASQNI